MKKYYKFFFLLLFGLFVFIPKETFAKTQQMLPDDIRVYQNNDLLATREPEYNISDGWELYGSGFTSAISKVIYRYSDLGNLEYEKSYDINFIIRQPNISVSNLNGYNEGKPIVLANDTVCTVEYSSSSNQNSSTYLPLFGVSCKNVYFDNTRGLNINVLTPLYSYTFGINTNFYGISAYIGYNETQHSEEITGALDKNTESVKEQTEATKEQTDTIKDSDTSGANDDADSFFGDFESDDFGLSSIITMPLQFIQGLSSSTCYSLNLPLPFVDTNVSLPCMTSIYERYFGDFLTLYQIITTGFIAYGVCINIFRLVQGFKNPDNDNVEVMEL